MLSLEQQNIIENSIWVVNTALKRQGLQADEDLRQSAILYLCKCIERFDPTKKIKWTTYAYKNIFLYIKRTHGKENKKSSMFVDDDIMDLQEPQNLPIDDRELFNDSKYMVEQIKAVCSPEERQIIEFKLQGYKVIEIGALMGCSASKVNGCMQSIREKAKEIQL